MEAERQIGFRKRARGQSQQRIDLPRLLGFCAQVVTTPIPQCHVAPVFQTHFEPAVPFRLRVLGVEAEEVVIVEIGDDAADASREVIGVDDGEPARRFREDRESVLRLPDVAVPGRDLASRVAHAGIRNRSGDGKHSRARSWFETWPRGSMAYVATFPRRMDSIMSSSAKSINAPAPAVPASVRQPRRR